MKRRRCPAIPAPPNLQCITKGHQITYCTTTTSGDPDYFFGTVIRVEQNDVNFTVDVQAGDCVQTLDSSHRPEYLVSVKGGEREVHDAYASGVRTVTSANTQTSHIHTRMHIYSVAPCTS